jgi:hypothetical protein
VTKRDRPLAGVVTLQRHGLQGVEAKCDRCDSNSLIFAVEHAFADRPCSIDSVAAALSTDVKEQNERPKSLDRLEDITDFGWPSFIRA